MALSTIGSIMLDTCKVMVALIDATWCRRCGEVGRTGRPRWGLIWSTRFVIVDTPDVTCIRIRITLPTRPSWYIYDWSTTLEARGRRHGGDIIWIDPFWDGRYRSLFHKRITGGPITKIDAGLPWTSSKIAFKDNMVGVEGAKTLNSSAEISERYPTCPIYFQYLDQDIVELFWDGKNTHKEDVGVLQICLVGSVVWRCGFPRVASSSEIE